MVDSVFLTFPLVDMTVPLDGELPVRAGTTTPIRTVVNEPGGPANILIAARRMGCSILPVGLVGDDYYGSFLLEAYRREGIDTSRLKVRPGLETRKVLVLVDRNGQHAYISMLEGAFEPLPDLEDLMASTRSLCLSGYMLMDRGTGSEIMRAVRLARKLGRAVFFDPGPLIPQIPADWMDEVLASSDAVILNDEEARLLSGLEGMEEGARAIGARTAGRVVVKAGPGGCHIWEDGAGYWYPGFSVPLVDTTGAGDSFLGAYIFAALSGWDRETAALFSNAMGAAMVSKRGSGTQVPTFGELVKVLEDGGCAVPAETRRRGRFGALTLRRELDNISKA